MRQVGRGAGMQVPTGGGLAPSAEGLVPRLGAPTAGTRHHLALGAGAQGRGAGTGPERGGGLAGGGGLTRPLLGREMRGEAGRGGSRGGRGGRGGRGSSPRGRGDGRPKTLGLPDIRGLLPPRHATVTQVQ